MKNITTPELISLLRDNINDDEYEYSELNPVYQQAGRMTRDELIQELTLREVYINLGIEAVYRGIQPF